MSTIFATRRGFHYQDKVALYLFLKHFRSRNLTSFFVDYPLADQKSLDIRLLTRVGSEEKVYEIKTGETFKDDEVEIASSMLDLHTYGGTFPSVKLHLYMNHGYLPTISEYWSHLTILRRYKILNSDRAHNSAQWLMEKLNFDQAIFPDQKSVHTFCSQIAIDDLPADCNTSQSPSDPQLEGLILEEIESLISELGADSTNYEYPKEILFHNLLYHLVRMSGSGEDTVPIIQDCIIEYITMRKLFSEHYPRPTAVEQKKGEIKTVVQSTFNQWWTRQPTLPIANRSLTE